MNKIIYLFASLLLFAGCKKEKFNTITLGTTVNVVNAVVNGTAIKVNPNAATGIVYKTAPQVAYGAGALYFVPRSATPFTIVSSADTTKVLLNTVFDFKAPAYSLFLAGQSPAIDTILKAEENYPFINNSVAMVDSSINIRFANLSPSSSPVSINIKNSAVKEVTGLSYKGITDFKKYAARSTNTSYIFEIRDATTNTLLSTYTFAVTATNRFKNVALVIRGLAGTTSGAAAFGVFTANYF